MTSPHIPVTGGCLCGAVRFESKEPPFEGFYCHCTICQRAYGGLFSATLRVPGSAFRFTKGEPNYYRATNFATRSFCADCGSPLPFFADANQDVWIKIGSLDHPEDWPMTKDATWGHSKHWHLDTKIRWEEISDGLPRAAGTLADYLKGSMKQAARMSDENGD